MPAYMHLPHHTLRWSQNGFPAIQNAFLEKVAAGERFMTGCRHCIKTCDPKTAPYCITRALINAATGDVDNGLLFCGSNAWRAQKIERTVDIMEEMA